MSLDSTSKGKEDPQQKQIIDESVTSLSANEKNASGDENKGPSLDLPKDSNSDVKTMPTDETGAKLSKNALKRKLKLERSMEVKKRRKQQEKEVKLAKAKKEGRDIEQEKMLLEQRRLEGKGKQLRQAKWEQNQLPHAKKSFKVCIDCSFESSMTPKEINSLALQIRYCYSINNRSQRPCMLSVSSLSGTTLDHLKSVSGFEEWTHRAFSYTHESVEQLFSDQLDRVVYLTSDSENEIQDLDDNKIYVIGGIVDRNRLKRTAIDRAVALGITTAKLPLDKYLQEMPSTRVLTCNHVFDILNSYKVLGKDWGKALLQVLPQRKHAKPVQQVLQNDDPNSNKSEKKSEATEETPSK